MNTPYYPPGKFYFSVTVLSMNAATVPLTGIDSSFQEVSGIEVEFGVEEIAEGGENRFLHRLPKQAKAPPLVLKRGVVTVNSPLAVWVASTLGSRLSTPILPQDLLVLLLSPSGDPLVAWGFANAYPLKWKTDSLNSTQSDILTESLEFSYTFSSRVTFGSSQSVSAGLSKLANDLN
jgi:phage tail-like protein